MKHGAQNLEHHGAFPPESVPPASITAGHEISGVNTFGVWVFIASFVIVGLALHVVLYFILGGIVKHVRQNERKPPVIGMPLPDDLDQPLQPSPGHPTLPWQDLAAMKAAQEARLHSYGRIPNDPAHARIPIDRAMELLLQSGALKQKPNAADTQPYINTTQPAPTENRS